MKGPNGRIAVVDGVRTPFVKAGTAYKDVPMQDLGAFVVKSLAERQSFSTDCIEEVIFGAVLLDPRTPNWAREVAYAAELPARVYAHAVSNNCISGLVAAADAAQSILLGRISCGIVGGMESMSRPPLMFKPKAASLFLELARTRGFLERAKLLRRLRPSYFFPQYPGFAEPSTGLSMGEHMELTAQELKVSREAQDQIAYESHIKAARADREGLFRETVVSYRGVEKDLLIREDTSLARLSGLQPVFDRRGKGSITAGNSSALTDGASAVLLMSEEQASCKGVEPLAYISDWEFSAIDPRDGLLMAPAVSVPRLLRRLNLRLEDFDLLEVHEAFAAQIVANIWAWENGWREEPVGRVNREKMNTLGGSIALGHPFSATGGRLIIQLARELKRRAVSRGLISVCAAGAMAGAMVLERD